MLRRGTSRALLFQSKFNTFATTKKPRKTKVKKEIPQDDVQSNWTDVESWELPKEREFSLEGSISFF